MKRIGPPSVRISPRCIRYSLGDMERFIAAKMVQQRPASSNILKREGAVKTPKSAEIDHKQATPG